jgi:S-adenosyl-L-methionine hydrolase (adenosine-forming)
MARITLLTDFGSSDGYVPAMKGVIASVAPDASVEDAGHDLAPGDVTGAAIALWRYWQLYPAGTVHVVVVDPGVGSERRGIAFEADGRFLVGPDNGVFSYALRSASSARAVALENREYFRESVSWTFHGRDVFAPVAAHIASGVALESFGPAVADPVRLPWPEPVHEAGEIAGVVVHVDRYGSLITNIPAEWSPADSAVRVGELIVGRVQRTYADVAEGEVVPLIGSLGLLEISVRDGSAAQLLRASAGSPVWVTS